MKGITQGLSLHSLVMKVCKWVITYTFRLLRKTHFPRFSMYNVSTCKIQLMDNELLFKPASITRDPPLLAFRANAVCRPVASIFRCFASFIYHPLDSVKLTMTTYKVVSFKCIVKIASASILSGHILAWRSRPSGFIDTSLNTVCSFNGVGRV